MDSHHWLADSSAGDMHRILGAIRTTTGQVIDEFEKVEQLRAQAQQQLQKQEAALEEVESENLSSWRARCRRTC